MLVLALVLVGLAVLLFTVQAFKENFQNLATIGLGFFAGSIAAWLIDSLHTQGKL